MYKKIFKRILGFLISFVSLLVLSPFLLGITIWLHFANKGAGAFYTQERPGKGGKVFKLIKFKSMTDERDNTGKLLPDKQRLTRVGKFVRTLSIDELPQLINILKGDMALIGPRPLFVEYLTYYSEEESHRHDVRPGITGWAQVNGRNDVTWEQKFAYDLEYVNNCSLAFDFKIFCITIMKILKRSDIQLGTDIKAGRFDDHRKRQLMNQ